MIRFIPQILLFYTVFFGFIGAPAAKPVDYVKDIKPILDQRCVACHSCYLAPCQLKLSSYEGLLRGLSKHEIYSPTRLGSMEPSRLEMDARGNQWREAPYEFSPVLPHENEGDEKKPFDFLTAITLQRKLWSLPLNGDEERTENSWSCPADGYELKGHLEERRNAGMPYGLPPLSDEQIRLIQTWILEGAPGPDLSVLTVHRDDLATVRLVESYFLENRKSAYGRLINRYVYEHLYAGHLFTGVKSGEAGRFYRLIRSRNRCEKLTPEDEIGTRRPWELPGTIGEEEFYYCLRPVTETITQKDHIVYRMDRERIARYRELFPHSEDLFLKDSSDSRSIEEVEGYIETWNGKRVHASRTDEYASNPFPVFKRIPIRSRYNFILDDLKYTITNFIRGPVCRGNTAVNAIDDQFWVYMIRPDSDLLIRNEEFRTRALKLMALPARTGSDALVTGIPELVKNRDIRNEYRSLRNEFYRKEFPEGYSLQDLWDGRQGSRHHPTQLRDPVLTVFRHYDSANVEYGNIGTFPKTSFIMDYSLVERLYYALVAGFDVFGDVQHQLATRFYMDYLRMESEELFLSFLPPESREPLRNSWYRQASGLSERIDEMFFSQDFLDRHYPQLGLQNPTKIQFSMKDPESQKREFFRKIHTLLNKTGAVSEDPLNPEKSDILQAGSIGRVESIREFEHELAKITGRRHADTGYVNFFPDHSCILLRDSSQGKNLVYTLIRNKTHANVLWLDSESKRRTLPNDTLLAYRGLTGSYPNIFFDVDLQKARDFLNLVTSVNDPVSYDTLVSRFGRSPNDSRFWDTYDDIVGFAKRRNPLEAGIIDLTSYNVPSNIDTPYWKGERGEKGVDMERSFFEFNLLDSLMDD